MDDKIKINLNMAGITLTRTIERQEEEIARSAAEQVNKGLDAYRNCYPNESQQRLLVMVAYQFAQENLLLKQRNDTKPYAEKIQGLTELLESYFQEIEEK